MLIFHYGSPIHILTLLAVAGLVCGLYFGLRKKPRGVRLTLLYALAAVNVVQHLFKFLIWPHAWGTSFSHINTAYNVCAVMILLTPFFLKRSEGAMRETISYVGTFGCILSLFIPYWFAGQSLTEFWVFWEYIRFLFCHVVLLCTSLLPVLWGMVRFRAMNFWKIGLYFFSVLAAILVNDVLCICMGLTDGSAETMYETLTELNPLWMICPPAGFDFYVRIVTALTPSLFLGKIGGVYTPILWYFVPLYFLITLLAIPFGYFLEHFLPKDEPYGMKLLARSRKSHTF